MLKTIRKYESLGKSVSWQGIHHHFIVRQKMDPKRHTIVLDDTNTQHKIRLAGIDAIEKRQAFGKVFKQEPSRYSRREFWGGPVGHGYRRKLGNVLRLDMDCILSSVPV